MPTRPKNKRRLGVNLLLAIENNGDPVDCAEGQDNDNEQTIDIQPPLSGAKHEIEGNNKTTA